MAVATPSSFTTGTKTTDATSAAVASKSYVSGRLYLLTAISKSDVSADPPQPTAAGSVMNFTAIDSGVYDNDSSSRRRITLFYCIAPSNVTEVVTITWTGQTQVTMAWAIDEIASGFDTSGTIVQHAQTMQPDGSGFKTSITATLAAFSSVNNATYFGFGNGNGTIVPSVGSGYSQVSLIRDTSENNLTVLTGFRSDNNTTPNATFSSDMETGIIGIEIKAASTTSVKTFNGLAYASTKTINGLALASIKTFNGLA